MGGNGFLAHFNFKSKISQGSWLVLAFVTLIHFSALGQELYVGAAKRIITPDPLLPVSGGVGKPHPANQKKGDLYVRTMVFQKGETKIAIVNIDNLGWPSVLGDKSRALIKSIPPENIIIGVTHTHSAPDAYAFPDEKGNTFADLDYLNWCVQQIADAVNEAYQNKTAINLKVNVGEAKGKIAYNYYAPQLYDPRCGVIQAINKSDNKVVATLVNYAIHPEVIGNRQGILTPDMAGPLYDRIEKNHGGIAVFMNGAQGGMITADVRRPDGKENNTWEECIRIGELLADEATKIINRAEIQTNPDLISIHKDVAFPVDSEMMQFILNHSPLVKDVSKDNTVTTKMNILKIGSAKILTIPGEALPNIGYYLKRHMNTDHAFLFGLTNDAFGYILTKEDFNSFKRYDYVTRTSLGERTGDILIQESLALIKELQQINN